MTLSPGFQFRLFYEEAPLDLGTGYCCILDWKLVLDLVYPSLTEIEDWDKPSVDCC